MTTAMDLWPSFVANYPPFMGLPNDFGAWSAYMQHMMLDFAAYCASYGVPYP